MSKHRDVRLAIGALIAAALPGVEVRGFDGDTSVPEEIPAGGLVLGLQSDPGEPEVDLSPLAYNYTHEVPIDVTAPGGEEGEPLVAMLAAIGLAIEADRTLGGLVQFLEAEAPTFADRTEGGVTTNWAEIAITAEYSCASPLG